MIASALKGLVLSSAPVKAISACAEIVLSAPVPTIGSPKSKISISLEFIVTVWLSLYF